MNFFERYKVDNNRSNNEFYRVYERNGEFIREINVQDEKKLTNEFLYGVTCFVVNENNEVLMEIRANTELTPGKIDLVSGHVNGNEHGTKAVIRELNEEVGILNVGPNMLHKVNGSAKPLGFESRGKIRNFFIDFYCLLTRAENVTSIQKEEVKSLKWVPMEQAFEMIKNGKTKFPKQGANVNYEQIFKNVRGVCLNKNLQEKKVVEK
ncbi:MAG: NUDIX hydrolase [Clostridia bacterium]|nr:NUDIX hydrolase [Clostridia bacterium]